MIIYFILNAVVIQYISIAILFLTNSIINKLLSCVIILFNSLFYCRINLLKIILMKFLNEFIKLSKLNIQYLEVILIEKEKGKKSRNFDQFGLISDNVL